MFKSTADYGWRNWPALSTVMASIEYSLNPKSYLQQYIFPVIVLGGVVILSPSLQGSMGDSRIAIPPTALMTLIFLQQSYNTSGSVLANSTDLDRLDNFCCLIAFVLLCLFYWDINLYDAARHASVNSTRLKAPLSQSD